MVVRDPLQALVKESLALLRLAEEEHALAAFEFPERRAFGEIATTFAFRAASTRRKAPRTVAEELLRGFQAPQGSIITDARVEGAGYINLFARRDVFGSLVINSILELGGEYGAPETPSNAPVLIEHTSVNPNKPWHIGHLRNAVLGDTVARILRKAGFEVEVQNYINDAGRQIAETVYALERFGAPDAPEEKFDHFVSQYYVRFHDLVERSTAAFRARGEPKEAARSEFEPHIVEALHRLEEGAYRPLIEKVVKAQLETAWKLGIFYDLLSWETDIVNAHIFEEAIGLIRQSPRVYTPSEGHYAGCLIIEPDEVTDSPHHKMAGRGEGEPEDAVVLVRSNGIPTYAGKDIPYQLWKFGLLEADVTYDLFCTQPNGRVLLTSSRSGERRPRPEPDRVINVIGDHQAAVQEVVYSALKLLGFEEQYRASRHLSYGLVRLEEGAMSGRRGVGVAADELLEMVYQEALEQVKLRRESDLDAQHLRSIAEAVSIGAIRYEMCRYRPETTIIFRIKDVLNLRGYCAVYLLYAYVRCRSVLQKARDQSLPIPAHVSFPAAAEEIEFELVYKMAAFPHLIQRAADALDPSQLTTYGYDLATLFHQFYGSCPVLTADPQVREVRLGLVKAVSLTLETVFQVLGIPLVEEI
jgi:arginyl-tRNA synthetase